MPNLPTQPVRVALYTRVSTDEQREGQTINSQIKELERYAETNNWSVADIYKDEGWSGAALARPELDRLRDDAGRKQFDLVLINDVDRLARDVTHLNVIRRDLERKGVRVVFRKLPGELSPTQNLMINILGSFAEFERELILDRTRRGVRYKVEIRKEYLGCRPAYGYRYTSKAKSPDQVGKLEISSEEAVIVRKMFSWVEREGLSARQVVTRLNELGIPARSRGKWAKSSVLRVLRNEMYAGVWHYNKHYSYQPKSRPHGQEYSKTPVRSSRLRSRSDWISVPLSVDLQLVSRKQWEHVQMKVTANTAWSPRHSKHNYLLRSLVICAGCRARIVGDPAHGSFGYRCSKRCKKVPGIVEGHLNGVVWEAVATALQNPKLIIQQGEKYYQERTRLRKAANIEQQQTLKLSEQLDLEERRILEAYRQGILEPAQLARELEALRGRKSAIQLKAQSLPDSSSEGNLPPDMGLRVTEYCRRVSAVLENCDFQQKQALLRILVREIVFDGKQVIIRARMPKEADETADSAPSGDEEVSRVSAHSSGIETTLPRLHGRNPAEFYFELVKDLQPDVSKVNAARRANLVKANAALLIARGADEARGNLHLKHP